MFVEIIVPVVLTLVAVAILYVAYLYAQTGGDFARLRVDQTAEQLLGLPLVFGSERRPALAGPVHTIGDVALHGAERMNAAKNEMPAPATRPATEHAARQSCQRS